MRPHDVAVRCFVAVLVSLAACGSARSPAERIVGRWVGRDAVESIEQVHVFHRDGAYGTAVTGTERTAGVAVVRGRWTLASVQGDEVVVELRLDDGRTERMSLRFDGDERFVSMERTYRRSADPAGQ